MILRVAAIILASAAPAAAPVAGSQVERAHRPAPASFVGALARTARVGRLSIRPLAVLEDSRCPANANCIQAGTVRLRVAVSGARFRRTIAVGLGSPAAIDGRWLHLAAVCPNRIAGVPVSGSAYRFNFVLSPNANPVWRDPDCT